MISNTLFLTYTIMCFLGLQAITLVLMIIRHNESGNTRLMKVTRNFVIVSLVLGLFYYISFYRELVLGDFAYGALSRGLDAVIFYAMGYSWVKLIDAMTDSPNPKLIKWRKLTPKVFLCLMILSAAAYMFLLNDYYATDYDWAEATVIILEGVLGLTVVIFTLAYVLLSFGDLTDGMSRSYIIIVSILINFNNLWNNLVVCFVFVQAVSPTIISSKLYGVTAVLVLIINLLTVIYIYKKDFSPFFFGKKESRPRPLSEEEVVDLVAESHRLTERERSVLVLAYQGLTNPDIAEKLFISRHTVKRHMHNIFEKMDVSTRVEMIRLIQSQVNPQKKSTTQ
ncbi:MAG: helix-turn-helix transcriptional regulator [Firmicutes bacterium]|nr:helix-turn-helix transcriptional regulator [Bacillota bacterium]NBI64772.1 LuxR family transcriptional regulator [Clostridiales bacterium]